MSSTPIETYFQRSKLTFGEKTAADVYYQDGLCALQAYRKRQAETKGGRTSEGCSDLLVKAERFHRANRHLGAMRTFATRVIMDGEWPSKVLSADGYDEAAAVSFVKLACRELVKFYDLAAA